MEKSQMKIKYFLGIVFFIQYCSALSFDSKNHFDHLLKQQKRPLHKRIKPLGKNMPMWTVGM